MKALKRVLVANRGEIACRIMRTLRAMGIESVAIHSDPDATAPHVKAADIVHAIGGTDAASSYLDAPKILAAARATKADAIHPGYGFLSENAQFSTACALAGVVFIGPSGAAIEKLGDKQSARALAQEVGVQVVPGAPIGADNRAARDFAKKVGLPVLVKAAAGGGGKGMRRVDHLDELDEALAASRREARAAFGNDALLLEKLIEGARHVEVQILADGRRVVPILERDCSLQRRHQKIIEECPAPLLKDGARSNLLMEAGRLVSAGGYQGAGTVEFLVGAKGDPYFLEMNTRLQVEHPVTEMVCGLDLVEWQVLIASGVGFAERKLDIQPRGHAIEARVCAEDPRSGFLPQPGTLTRVAWPQAEHVRVDSGVETGSAVSEYYDPLLAKVIAWGADRNEARLRLAQALCDTVLCGVTTNIPFLVATLRSDRFERGNYDTSSVERGTFKLDPARDAPREDALLLAAVALTEASTAAPAVEREPAPPSQATTTTAGLDVTDVASRTGDASEPASGRPVHAGPFDAVDGFRIVKGGPGG